MSRGFTIELSLEQLRESIIGEIAKICNLPAEEVDMSELVSLYEFTANSQLGNIPPLLIEKYYGIKLFDLLKGPRIAQHVGRRMSEIGQRLFHLIDAYYGLNLSTSYGSFLPTYVNSLREIKKETGLESHRSLLLGALTLNTVVEYKMAMNLVFENANSYITDINGLQTHQAGDFVFGDARQLPFAQETMDTLHTNFLLHELSRKADKNTLPELEALLAEAYRVLKLGGSMIMVEGNLAYTFDTDREKFIKAQLKLHIKRAGFSEIVPVEPLQFKSRQILYRKLLASSISWSPEELSVMPDAVAYRLIK